MQIQGYYTGGGQRNMMQNADIIVFNKAVGADRREVFLPTVIHNVCWYGSRSLDASGSATGSFAVRIPFVAEVEGRKKYKPEREYASASYAEKKHSWTLQKNCYVMMLRKGVIGNRLEFDPDEVLDLSKRCDEFFTVTEYADNTTRGTTSVKHWRIGGS